MNEDNDKNVRMATLHSLRRVFLHFLSTNKLGLLETNSNNKKKKEFQLWLKGQLDEYVDVLLTLLSSGSSQFQAAATRTIIEVYSYPLLL